LQAALDLRILRAEFSQNAVHKVRWQANQPRLDAKIVGVGPRGSIAASTDSDGIFEAKDLPAGHYELHTEQCDERKGSPYDRCSGHADLSAAKIWGVALWSNQ
jgi:hypothetical protein